MGVFGFVIRFVYLWIYNWFVRLFCSEWDLVCGFESYAIYRNGVVAHLSCEIEKLKRMDLGTVLMVDEYEVYTNIDIPHPIPRSVLLKIRAMAITDDYKESDVANIFDQYGSWIMMEKKEGLAIPDSDD